MIVCRSVDVESRFTAIDAIGNMFSSQVSQLKAQDLTADSTRNDEEVADGEAAVSALYERGGISCDPGDCNSKEIEARCLEELVENLKYSVHIAAQSCTVGTMEGLPSRLLVSCLRSLSLSLSAPHGDPLPHGCSSWSPAKELFHVHHVGVVQALITLLVKVLPKPTVGSVYWCKDSHMFKSTAVMNGNLITKTSRQSTTYSSRSTVSSASRSDPFAKSSRQESSRSASGQRNSGRSDSERAHRDGNRSESESVTSGDVKLWSATCRLLAAVAEYKPGESLTILPNFLVNVEGNISLRII